MINQSYERAARIQQRAYQIYDETFMFGCIVRAVRWLLRLPIQLRFLDNVNRDQYTPGKVEQRAVDLDAIVGTSGRANRFDNRFRPMQRRNKDRWASIAMGMMDDITRVPPINVIQVGEEYYVVDGHHRVSAARALRKVFIDARVTVWEPID
jgi:hypothetical protein